MKFNDVHAIIDMYGNAIKELEGLLADEDHYRNLDAYPWAESRIGQARREGDHVLASLLEELVGRLREVEAEQIDSRSTVQRYRYQALAAEQETRHWRSQALALRAANEREME